MKVIVVISFSTYYVATCTIWQLFLLSRFWINNIIWFLSYKEALPWDWMLQFLSWKCLLNQQSQKRPSKKSCGYYNMVHQWPMEVGSIKSPMGSAFRASIGHSTTCCEHRYRVSCFIQLWKLAWIFSGTRPTTKGSWFQELLANLIYFLGKFC